MEFYSSIADFYREIFPMNPAQMNFILSVFQNPEKCTLLDVGCGAGDLAGSLAPHFKGVHGIDLDHQEAVYSFLEQAGEALRPGGQLLIQIIHYDRILDQDIRALPTIDSEHYRFERNYHYLPVEHRIEFETIATQKETGAKLSNLIRLFGNFQKAPMLPGSIPLVIQAVRQDT